MPRKRKRKWGKAVESEHYEIDIEDWEESYFFQINKTNRKFIPGDYWEHSGLILWGKIVSPTIKNASRVRIDIRGTPELDEHWKQETVDHPPQTIGWMAARRDNILAMNCDIPSRSFQWIPAVVTSGKVRYASISGTKLKWGQGRIFGISLSTNREDE